MKALLLSAGLGTRLGKLTEETPKPMLKINGRPLLDILVRKLLNLGVEHIYINVHHKREVIKKFINQQDYSNFVTLIFEKELLGTAGTLKENLNRLNTGDFFVLHADNYFEDDLKKLVIDHATSPESCFMTMGTFITKSPETCGTVEIDNNGFVRGFFEKDPLSKSLIANSAIYLFKMDASAIITSLSESETDISIDLIPKLKGKIMTSPLSGHFIDIGTPESLKSARQVGRIR